MLSNVDLPDPEDPMMATNSPVSTARSTPFNTCRDWAPVVYVFVIPSRSIMGPRRYSEMGP